MIPFYLYAPDMYPPHTIFELGFAHECQHDIDWFFFEYGLFFFTA